MAASVELRHEGYSFAVREFQSLGLSGTPSYDERAQLLALVNKRLRAQHPHVDGLDLAQASEYGVDQAIADNTRTGSEIFGADVPQPAAVDISASTAHLTDAWRGLMAVMGRRLPGHLARSRSYRNSIRQLGR